MGAFAGALEGIRLDREQQNEKSQADENFRRKSLVELYKGLAEQAKHTAPAIAGEAYNRAFEISNTPYNKKLRKDIGDLGSLLAIGRQEQQSQPQQPQTQPQAPQSPAPTLPPVGGPPPAPGQPQGAPQALPPGLPPIGDTQAPQVPPMAPGAPIAPPSPVQQATAGGMSGQEQLNRSTGQLPNLGPVPDSTNVTNPQTAGAWGQIFPSPMEIAQQQANAQYQQTFAIGKAKNDLDNAQRAGKLAGLQNEGWFKALTPNAQAEILAEAGYGVNNIAALRPVSNVSEQKHSYADRNGQVHNGVYRPGIGYFQADGVTPLDPIDNNPVPRQQATGAEVAEVETLKLAFQDKHGRPPTHDEVAKIRHEVNLSRRRPMQSPNSVVWVVDKSTGQQIPVSPAEAKSGAGTKYVGTGEFTDVEGNTAIGGIGGAGIAGSRGKPAAIPEDARQQLSGIQTNLKTIGRVNSSLGNLRNIMGPGFGRISKVQMSNLGGAGMNQKEVNAAVELSNLIKSTAFQEAGKALTGTEYNIVFDTMPQLTDTFETAVAKIELMNKVLNDKRQSIQQNLNPMQRRSLGGNSGVGGAVPKVGDTFQGKKVLKVEKVQ